MIPVDTPVWLAVLLVSGLMSAIVAVRYFLTSGLFAWLTGRLRPGLYQGLSPQIWREIRYSLVAAAIYGAPAGVAFWLWNQHGRTQIYGDWLGFPLWYLPLSVLIYLIVQDSWFYWTHRAMHASVRLFRIAHGVHHQSRPPTAWTAMSFHPVESLSGAIVIPILVFICLLYTSPSPRDS